MSPYRLLAVLKVAVLLCWPPAVRAAALTFDQAVAQITLRESLLLGVLMTLAGVTALLFRISSHVNAEMDEPAPMLPIRNLPLLAAAHMCGSWLAGVIAYFAAAHLDMPGLLVGVVVPLASFGGAKTLELMYNRFIADRLAPPRAGANHDL